MVDFRLVQIYTLELIQIEDSELVQINSYPELIQIVDWKENVLIQKYHWPMFTYDLEWKV